jgi:hypothetical protein
MDQETDVGHAPKIQIPRLPSADNDFADSFHKLGDGVGGSGIAGRLNGRTSSLVSYLVPVKDDRETLTACLHFPKLWADEWITPACGSSPETRTAV